MDRTDNPTANPKDRLSSVQIGREYVALLKQVAKLQVPKTSMRQHTERWILSEAAKHGVIKRKGE